MNIYRVLQQQIVEKIQDVPADDDEARKRAELLLCYMHLSLANAHLAIVACNHDQSEALFDLAEEAGREAFSVNKLHVARYTDASTPYKLALGAILSAGKGKKVQGVGDGRYVSLGLAEVLCRIQKIDPDEMREACRVWQEGKDADGR